MFEKISTYEEAVALIHKVGFMPLSNNRFGFISLEGVTEEKNWHTGEPVDPWLWKDRIAFEKKASYSRIMDRRLSFVDIDFYPYVISAYKSPLSIQDRYEDGLLSPMALSIFKCLNNERPLSTSELKERLSITKENSSRFDNGMSELQCGFDITVFGASKKVNKQGQPYGWLISEYTTVEQWAPDEIFKKAVEIPRSDAIEKILSRVKSIAPDLSGKELQKFLSIKDLQ